jgi:hypothetical protein
VFYVWRRFHIEGLSHLRSTGPVGEGRFKILQALYMEPSHAKRTGPSWKKQNFLNEKKEINKNFWPLGSYSPGWTVTFKSEKAPAILTQVFSKNNSCSQEY